jgi:aspartate aminotransferase
VLTNPNNPTTTFLRRRSLQVLEKFACDNDLAVICDEAFCDHIYSTDRFTPAASLERLWERTLTIRSFSKGYGLSGIRVGYVIGPETLMDKLYGAAVNVLGATGSASQSAALAALDDPNILPGFHKDFSQRATMVKSLLSQVPGLRIAPIESGFLSWIDVSAFGSGDEVAQYLIHHAKVIVNSGAPYGPSGSHHIRIVQGVFKDPDRMRSALLRIKTALIQWPSPTQTP